jgi:hypothetical protein
MHPVNSNDIQSFEALALDEIRSAQEEILSASQLKEYRNFIQQKQAERDNRLLKAAALALAGMATGSPILPTVIMVGVVMYNKTIGKRLEDMRFFLPNVSEKDRFLAVMLESFAYTDKRINSEAQLKEVLTESTAYYESNNDDKTNPIVKMIDNINNGFEQALDTVLTKASAYNDMVTQSKDRLSSYAEKEWISLTTGKSDDPEMLHSSLGNKV